MADMPYIVAIHTETDFFYLKDENLERHDV